MEKRTKFYRFLEIIPGGLIWLTFVVAIILSFVKPVWVIYFIVVFDLYWLFRVMYFAIYVLVSYKTFKRDINIDWMQKVINISDWNKIYQLVILPMYKEPLEVIRASLESISKSDYPNDKFIIVLAGEERAKEHFSKISQIISREYGKKFFKLLITVHPDSIAGEIKAKGANANYAGKKAKEFIDEQKIPYENIISSCFDIDTSVHQKYFSCLAYKYLTNPNPTHSSYQPAVLYNNNIWDAPAMMRVAAFGTVFWLLSELARPERLFTFSSHSMSFKALVDVGFWQNDVVSDDSRIFLQCFFRYNGDYNVVPMYVPLSMDTVLADGYKRSFINLYKQQRRWAWGVENFPYMVSNFQKNKLVPLKKKIKFLWNQVEGMYSWATAPILMFVLGRLPLYFLDSVERSNILISNAPIIMQNLMRLAMAGVVISSLLSLFLLPKRPKSHPKYKYAIMILQWILLPITFTVFGSIPSIDSQTRLMLGKYLGFWVTEKARKK